MTLSLRPAELVDIPMVFGLLDDQKDQLFDDFSGFSLDSIRELQEAGQMLVIADSLARGVIWVHSQVVDLHLCVFAAFERKRLKSIMKSRLLEQAIDLIFEDAGVRKIKVPVLSSQPGSQKLLLKMGFRSHKPFHKETYQGGIITDVTWFDLTRHYWKNRKETA